MRTDNTLIGRRVLNRWQDHKRGVITAVESGVNGGVRVRFDERDYDVAMVASDMAFEDVYSAAGSNVGECLRGWQKTAQVKDGMPINVLAHEFTKKLIFHYSLVSAA